MNYSNPNCSLPAFFPLPFLLRVTLSPCLLVTLSACACRLVPFVMHPALTSSSYR